MSRRFRILISLIAVGILGVIYIYQYQYHRGPQVGSMAPNFTLEDLQHQSLSLESFRGKAILLNFWATWCGPCQMEMPSLESLYEKYRNRGFVVLGVSVDEEGWSAIQDFLKQVQISFPIVNDKNQDVSELYQTYRVPETYLIDSHGKIVSKFVGPQDYNREFFFKKVEGILPRNPS